MHNESRGFGEGERFEVVYFPDSTDPTGDDSWMSAFNPAHRNVSEDIYGDWKPHGRNRNLDC